MELHLAVGFVAVYWRREGLLLFLQRTLFLPWVLVIPVAVVSGVTGSLTLARWFCVCVVVVVLGLYICASYRATWYPAPAERSADRMVWLYSVSFLLTVGPLVVASVSGLPQDLAEAPASLNGVANVILYTCVLKFSRQSPDTNVNDHRTPSIFVTWSGMQALPVGFAIENEEFRVHVDQSRALAQSERDLRSLEAAVTSNPPYCRSV